ncbi:hypothetical protein RB195_009618 [Necator americanus]|uniref:Anoctamin n=1 Tax=Necator americanus TaxID=51031 RepID=A0ABR1CU54_NECAM
MLQLVLLFSWFAINNAATSTSLTPTEFVGGNSEVCQIWKNMTKEEICDYVNYHDDICEGGGYLLWSQYVECQFDIGKKVGVIIAGVLWMFMLFIMVSTTADDFFSPSVSSIVAHLKISESIAGVTFMAFGNGAPDIFGSIASVLSSPKPKAGLALGELFGAGIFVTTMVTATIVLVRPFKIDVFSTIRDLIFYLIALAWIIFVFLYSTSVYIWEPSVYLGIYCVYILTVVISHQLHKRKRKKLRENSVKSKLSNVLSRQGSVMPVIPQIQIISDAVEKIKQEMDSSNGEVSEVTVRKELAKRASIAINGDTLNIFPTDIARLSSKLQEIEENDNTSEESSEEEFVVSHNLVLTGHEARSRAATLVPPPIKVVSARTFIYDIYRHLHPLPDDWNDLGRFSKAMCIIKMPSIFLLKLTVPLNEYSWSKSMAIIQAVVAPQWFLFSVQLTTVEPFGGSPGLYAYALVLSAIIIALLAVFTSIHTQPKYYKEFASYLGFLMSISWIYFISSEVVNVVTMLGVISHISHEVLGLTILAWSNSIGDLIADISVVKQGYPRMAMAAAIGGPLFNLLIGFGLPFLIAKANGRTVTINLNPTYRILLLFLGISLVTTLIVDYISAPFIRRNGELFLNYDNEKLFFSSAQREMLTHEILTQIDISRELEGMNRREQKDDDESQKSVISDEPLRRKGLQYLRMEKTYEDSFVLHEPSKEEPYFRKMKENSFVTYVELMQEIERDPRKKLSDLWSRFFRFQPLGVIREYFGEQIGFYFAWQGTFLTMLWPATLLGLAVFVYGFVKSVRTNPATFGNCTVINYVGQTEIVPCGLRNKMAQLFTTVSSWFMKSFDNELNAFFAAFVSVWGTMFYQIWRRNNSVLAYEWDCEDFNEVEPDRPDYHGTATRQDPVTGETEYFSPQIVRVFKYTISCIIVILSMCLVIVSVFLVTLYKLWVISNQECNKEYTFACSLLAAYVPSVMNTVSTMILGSVYGWMVVRLTDWENHRTNSEYHNALVVKMFALQMVNNYTSLFYIAFIRPENNGFQEKGLFGLGEKFRDVCLPGTCGSLLAVQLITHMIIKPLPKFTGDIIVPYVVRILRLKKWYSRDHQTMQGMLNENDETNVLVREWMKPTAGEFTQSEFNEKIILFGTTMMFAALFPLAPLIALIIGLIDLRVDALRLLWLNRRPIPVMTSVAFTSDFCSNFFSDVMYCDIKNRFLIVIVFQNMVFVLKYVFQSIIPTVPASIRVAQRRKRYVVNYVIEKGDVPYRVRNRKRTRNAKLAWIMSRARGGLAPRLIPKVGVETTDDASPSS